MKDEQTNMKDEERGRVGTRTTMRACALEGSASHRHRIITCAWCARSMACRCSAMASTSVARDVVWSSKGCSRRSNGFGRFGWRGDTTEELATIIGVIGLGEELWYFMC